MANGGGKRSIVIDVRCLQDPNYARRGVGRHALTLLRHAPAQWRMIGLIDRSLPALLPDARAVLEVVHTDAYAATRAARPRDPPAFFVAPSPMTHDPMFIARLLSDRSLLRACVIHDFIPRRSPERYLPSPAQRLNYATALRWLAHYDLFLPNSWNSGNDLRTLLKVPESAIVVTGCPLDPQFEQMIAADRPPSRHVLVVGGADARKNPDVVIRAHARSAVMQSGDGIPLVVAGNYSEQDAGAFRCMAEAAGGRADLVEVPGHVPDSALAELYGRAWVVVCSSFDEGFSIPAIEAMAAGVPCLVSDIPAHSELVADPECRFPPDNDAALRSQLEKTMSEPDWRVAMLMRQADVWPNYRASVVAERFWSALRGRLQCPAPNVARGHRPRVAMLSPLPPDRSGVADYTAATCVELGRLVDLHLFTDTERPPAIANVAAVRSLTALPHIDAGFDRVISVVGNSHFHIRIFELLLRYGAACIAHDARMLGFYYALLGQERALSVAARELDRPVSEAELKVWVEDEGKLEALFLSELAEHASPLLVHSPVTVTLVRKRYGRAATHLPFSIHRSWRPDELNQRRRAAARARLGLAPDEVVIVTFGFVHDTKAPQECVWALEILRGWGIPASLHFAGLLDADWWAIRPLAAQLGLERHVRFSEGYISEQTYRDYLVAADLAVQLRTYDLGGLSGALMDCAAAGLPTVTNASLAEAVGVPDYIHAVHDALSPVHIAEALADLLEAGLAANRPEAARHAFSAQRSFGNYAKRLCESLGLDVAGNDSAGR